MCGPDRREVLDGAARYVVTEPAPCPECGYDPVIGKSKVARSFVWMVECVNARCKFRPVSVGASPGDAVGRWNAAASRRLGIGGAKVG